MTGPLTGLRVIDLTRILAGPSVTQLFGDLGADIIKIERPGSGDDTRTWGPPFLQDDSGQTAGDAAYFMCTNRNKRSVTIDITTDAGQEIVRKLVSEADVFIENYKVGGLAKYGLSYADLAPANPRLVYCSITGFGQQGPYAKRAGYDYMIQAMSGLMSITGEPDGMPMKVGVAIADVMTGLYSSSAILAALHHRAATGRGQHIDMALLDSQMSGLINVAAGYFVSGQDPRRFGNAHPNIVPYRVYETSDSHIVLAVGNNTQFKAWADVAGCTELVEDTRFATNAERVRNREVLEPLVEAAMRKKTRDEWIASLETAGVPCGPVNTVPEAFDDPQAVARGMTVEMAHAFAAGGKVNLVGNPIKMSETPVEYRLPPPLLGEHTDEVLQEAAGLSADEIADLRAQGVVG